MGVNESIIRIIGDPSKYVDAMNRVVQISATAGNQIRGVFSGIAGDIDKVTGNINNIAQLATSLYVFDKFGRNFDISGFADIEKSMRLIRQNTGATQQEIDALSSSMDDLSKSTGIHKGVLMGAAMEESRFDDNLESVRKKITAASLATLKSGEDFGAVYEIQKKFMEAFDISADKAQNFNNKIIALGISYRSLGSIPPSTLKELISKGVNEDQFLAELSVLERRGLSGRGLSALSSYYEKMFGYKTALGIPEGINPSAARATFNGAPNNISFYDKQGKPLDMQDLFKEVLSKAGSHDMAQKYIEGIFPGTGLSSIMTEKNLEEMSKGHQLINAAGSAMNVDEAQKDLSVRISEFSNEIARIKMELAGWVLNTSGIRSIINPKVAAGYETAKTMGEGVVGLATFYNTVGSIIGKGRLPGAGLAGNLAATPVRIVAIDPGVNLGGGGGFGGNAVEQTYLLSQAGKFKNILGDVVLPAATSVGIAELMFSKNNPIAKIPGMSITKNDLEDYDEKGNWTGAKYNSDKNIKEHQFGPPAPSFIDKHGFTSSIPKTIGLEVGTMKDVFNDFLTRFEDLLPTTIGISLPSFMPHGHSPPKKPNRG